MLSKENEKKKKGKIKFNFFSYYSIWKLLYLIE